MFVEDMSRNKCFSQVQISRVLHFISIRDVFTDSPSYFLYSAGRLLSESKTSLLCDCESFDSIRPKMFPSEGINYSK
jgi:hypothetical protein